MSVGREHRIKLLHVITGLNVGGAEKAVYNLVKGLAAFQYRVDIAVLKGEMELKSDFEAMGCRIYAIGTRSNCDVRGVYRLYKLISENKYDIVHGHLFRAEIFAAIASGFAKNTRFIVTKHNDPEYFSNWLYYLINRLTLLFLTDRVIAISDHVKRYFVRKGMCAEDKITRIYYGFETTTQRRTTDSTLSQSDQPIIGTIARLSRQKGVDVLLRAYRKLLKAGSNCRLVVVGRGEEERELKKLSHALGIEKEIFWMGFRNDVLDLLSSFDIFILPSRWEGFGMVLAEAMALEKPVVSTRVSAIPEIVVDFVTGLLVPPDDSERLAAAVRVLLADQSLRKRMGFAGKKRIEQEFTIENMIQETEELYQLLLGGG